MPFRPMMLRSQRVFARCDEAGVLVVSDGRVEIRYKKADGRRYEAAARNLSAASDGTLVTDEAMGEAAPVEKREKPSPGGPKAASASGPAPTKAAPGEALVYADGACSGNPGPSGIGVVLVTTTERRELSEFLGEGTNNIAELTAILRAAEAFPEGCDRLSVYTDSSYSIGVLAKGWKAKANVELIRKVKAALALLPAVDLHHVRGHRGVVLNEAADRLAVQAVEGRRSTPWKTYPIRTGGA